MDEIVSLQQIFGMGEIQKMLGGTELSGKVIEAPPIYYMKPEFDFRRPVFALAILCLGLFILSQNIILLVLVGLVFLAFFVVMSLLHIHILPLLFDLVLLRAHTSHGKNDDVPVRDVVIQDSDGTHLVRIMGQLVIGNISNLNSAKFDH
jgi:hypothetical protein